MEIEKYSPKWLLEKINNSKNDAHKLMHIIEYSKEIIKSTDQQLILSGVVVELPSKKSKEFERWTQSKGYESAFNGLWYEKNNQTYNTNLLYRAFTNEIEFGN